MIILAPGALDKVFSAESSRKHGDAQAADPRFSAWLKTPRQDVPSSTVSTATPYKNRLTRFE